MIKYPNYRKRVESSVKDEGVHKEKVLPAILVASYFFYLMAPPLLIPANLRWYMHLGFCVLVYLINGKDLSARASKLYWFFGSCYFVGAVLSLFRSSTINNNLYLIIGSSVSFFSYLLLIPSLSSQSARRWMLAGLSLAALAWAFHIQSQMSSLSYLINPYYLKGPGNDKNFIAFVLALAVTAVFCILIIWEPRKNIKKWQVIVIRIGLVVAGVFLLYYVIFTYSRSGLIATGVGLLSVAGLYVVRKGRLRAILILAVIGFLAYQSIPFILQSAPQWVGYFSTERLMGGMRLNDFQKAVAIIADNPLIGIGIDATKNSYSSIGQVEAFERALPHNQYLKSWAELGLVGFMGYIVWLIFFTKKLRYGFFNLTMIDQIWMIIYIPFFTMLVFLDMETIVFMMLALMTGIFYLKPQQ